MLLSVLFVLACASADTQEVSDETIGAAFTQIFELFCGTALIAVGLYLNYFGRSVFHVFVYLSGATLGGYLSVFIACAVATRYGFEKDPYWLFFTAAALGAVLGSLLLRRMWKLATGAIGAFAGKAAVLFAFTVVPEAVYLNHIARMILISLGGIVGGVMAVRIERHAVIIGTAIAGTFVALLGYDTIRRVDLIKHFRVLMNLQANVTNALVHMKQVTENEELRSVLILSVFVTATGIYSQYRITSKHIDRD